MLRIISLLNFALMDNKREVDEIGEGNIYDVIDL